MDMGKTMIWDQAKLISILLFLHPLVNLYVDSNRNVFSALWNPLMGEMFLIESGILFQIKGPLH